MKNEYYLIGALVLFVFFVIGIYNRLVYRRNDVGNAFGSIDVMLKKRFDLLPNLVEVTKQFMNHEKELLSDITSLRSQIKDSKSSNEKIKKYNSLQKYSEGIMLNVENYPELVSNKNFIELQKSWNTTEDQISASRRYFNSAVTDYNNAVQTFPSNIIANIFNFKTMSVFEAKDVERNNISAKDIFES